MRAASMPTPRPLSQILLAAGALAFAAGVAGCPEMLGPLPYAVVEGGGDDDSVGDDDSAGDDDTTIECDLAWIVHSDDEVSLSGDLEPLFFEQCSNCHVPYVLGNLSLAPGQSWNNLVGVDNFLGYRDGMPRVEAGNPEGSYLLHKILGCDASDQTWGYLQGPMPPPLPKTQPLDGAQAGMLWAWIEQGALDN